VPFLKDRGEGKDAPYESNTKQHLFRCSFHSITTMTQRTPFNIWDNILLIISDSDISELTFIDPMEKPDIASAQGSASEYQISESAREGVRHELRKCLSHMV
jgi:hypothetical protein